MTGSTPRDPLPKQHGREADSPADIPALGWRDIAWRIWSRFLTTHIDLFAAGAAFFSLLAVVPALATLVAIYGIAFDPATVVKQVNSLSGFMPAEARSLLQDQLTRLAAQPRASLGSAAVFGFLFSLWSASSATKALIDGLNVVYGEMEKRNFLQYNAIALVMTVAGLVGAVALLGVTVFLPMVLDQFAPLFGQAGVWMASYAVLIVGMWLGISALYRWAPSRETAKWRWLAPGSFLAVISIVGFSLAFSWFARTFATYSAYGSLGVVAGSMTWCWISMVILLISAQVNAEAEHQTTRDSTTGDALPLGSRGAVMADTVGKTSD